MYTVHKTKAKPQIFAAVSVQRIHVSSFKGTLVPDFVVFFIKFKIKSVFPECTNPYAIHMLIQLHPIHIMHVQINGMKVNGLYVYGTYLGPDVQ